MKTREETLYVLTELEILKIDLDGHTAGVAGEINTVDLSKFKTLNQSQPSISAEEAFKEFLLKNGCTKKDVESVAFQLMAPENELREWKYFLAGFNFASRQGKVVEPINDKGDKCSGCLHYFTDKHNFCPNCGCKIKWIN